MLTFGIIEEGKIPHDERVPFTPRQCAVLQQQFPCQVIVQSSAVRRIPDQEYTAAGIEVRDDVQDCDVLMGVKEVPIDRLIPEKTYLFFSHTIKKQPYNKRLLQEVLKRKIRLIDYECLVDERDFRIIGFGRFAGLVGTYNGFRMIGQKTGEFDILKAHDCHDQQEMYDELKKVKTNKLRICLTGMGRVAHGALEILEKLGIRKVNPQEFLEEKFDEAVYADLDVTDYNKRHDGAPGSLDDLIHHPEAYISDFQRFLSCTDLYIACHFWDRRAPKLITPEDLNHPGFSIRYIADISCDINGPIATTLRASTIDDPFYGVNPQNLAETDFRDPNAIAVMAVDNLPCELPRDASEDFGKQLLKGVMPAFFDGDTRRILEKGTIAIDGRLMPRFEYLSDYTQ